MMVLPNSPPEVVHRSQNAIIGLLQDETKLIIRTEKLLARSHPTSPSSESDASVRTAVQHHLDQTGSELWFYW